MPYHEEPVSDLERGIIVNGLCGTTDDPRTQPSNPPRQVSKYPIPPAPPTQPSANPKPPPEKIWSRPKPITLTYALSPTNIIHYIDRRDILTVLERAFQRYSLVIPVTFVLASEYDTADVKVAFYAGKHENCASFGDSELAHAYYKEDGRIHMNVAKRWAMDSSDHRLSTHMESVFMHEIGHVLGLEHSETKEAVMHGMMDLNTKKVELTEEDVERIRALYGSNSNSVRESETNLVPARRRNDCSYENIVLTVMVCLFVGALLILGFVLYKFN